MAYRLKPGRAVGSEVRRIADRQLRLAIDGLRSTGTRTADRAVAPGLEKSVRRARRAMALALARPSDERTHTWRRRVKDLYLQVRLLQAVLVSDLPVSRHGIARCLRLLRRWQSALRAEACGLAAEVHRETPRHFRRRVRRHWRAATDPAAPPEALASWLRAA